MFKMATLLAISQGEHAFQVERLDTFLAHLGLIMPLINALPNMTFFVKNTEARYQLVNEHFTKRCNGGQLKNILGKRAEDVFHEHLGLGYTEQDLSVMSQQRRITNQLELHSYKSGLLGWCLTTKVPITNQQHEVIGVAGISVDVQDEKLIRPNINGKLSRVEQYISQKFDTPIKVQNLAQLAELSISQLDRQFKSIFQMTPQQFIQKKRLEHAIELLKQDLSITDISARCGYTDHSAFSRKFKELTTMTPSQFKKRL